MEQAFRALAHKLRGGSVMWIVLLSIVGSYGLCVALLHLIYGTTRLQSVPPTQIVLITSNNQKHIEWVVRSLFFSSWLKGRQIAATIVDKNSTDDTLKIIERLSHTHPMEIRKCPPAVPVEDVIGVYPQDVHVYRVNSEE
jgi:hypothetical protein